MGARTWGTCLWVALLGALGLPALAQDTTGPVLTGYTITPSTVDVTSGAQEVVVELTITDDESGVAQVSCSFFDNALGVEADLNWSTTFPLGLERISGDGLSGVYRGTVTVPALNPAEVWDTAISIVDEAGNGSPYDTILGGQPFPGGGDGKLTILNSGPVDAAPPVVTAYSLTPGTVDVGSGSQDVVVELTVTDDVSGVSLISVAFVDDLGLSTTSLFWTSLFGSLTRISGDEFSGTYQGVVTVPASLTPQVWDSVLEVQDASGGVRYYDTLFGGEPFPGGGTGELVIENSGGADSTPPVVTAYSLTPGTVDVSTGAQDVFIDLTVTDDSSGLAGIQIQFYDANYGVTKSLLWTPTAGDLVRVSGDELNGTYQGVVTVPGYIAADTWNSSVTVNDALQNARTLNTILLGEPFPPGADGKIVITNGGSVDASSPVLTSLSFAPATVDVGPGSQGVTVSLTATDDVSGIDFLAVDLYNSEGGFMGTLTFGSGADDELQRVSGDALNGTYEGVLVLSRYAAPDTWDSHVALRDSALRESSYGPAAGGEAFPGGVTGQLVVQNTGEVDVTAPALLAFTLTPATVDVSSGPQDVAVELIVDDAVSGLDEIFVGLIDIGALETRASISWSRVSTDGLTRFSGDANYGTYRGTITIPQFAGAGTLEAYVAATDIAGNLGIYADFFEPFPPGAVTEVVVQTPAAPDESAPVLTSFSMSPTTVDVVGGPQDVTVALDTTDDLSGVATIVVDFIDSNGGTIAPLDFGGAGNTLLRVLGDATNGSYLGTLTVPQYWPAGSLRAVVTVTDQANRSTVYDSSAGDPFPVAGSDVLTVENAPAPPSGSATADTLPPVLTDLRITPGTADVSTGPVEVTVEFDFVDNLSGAEFAEVRLLSRQGTLVATNLPPAYDPAGGFAGAAPLPLVAGDPLAGTFRAVFTLPAGAPPEEIPVSVRLIDAAGRTVLYGSEPDEEALPEGAVGALSVVNSNSTSLAKLGLWTTDFGLSGPESDPTANPSGDGSDNVLKWAFNIDPTVPDASLLAPGTGTSGLPVDTVLFDGANSIYRLEFLRRVGSGLVYTPVITTVLGEWTPVDTPLLITPIDENWERVVVEFPFDRNAVDGVYSRVGVSLP